MTTKREWLAKINRVIRETGYTTSLVRRENYLIVTIAPREGDITIIRKNGKNGMYAKSH